MNVNSVRVDGIRPRACCRGMAVVRAAAGPPSPVVRPVPHSSQCMPGEYCSHVTHCSLPDVWCSAVRVRPYSFVRWGILRRLPPRRGGGGGHCGWWGGIVWWGGMVDEGRVL